MLSWQRPERDHACFNLARDAGGPLKEGDRVLRRATDEIREGAALIYGHDGAQWASLPVAPDPLA
jgi:hypothetical protein